MISEQEAQNTVTISDAYLNFQKGLNSYAFFKLNTHQTSEDLVQQTFLKTWMYLVKGGKIELMKAFLYHVLNQLIVDQYRKRKTTSLDDLLNKGFEPGIDESKRLFNTLDGKTALLLIPRLPLKYRVVIQMRYERLLSISEMALITGQTKNAITVQLHRGLGKLRLLYNAPPN